MEIKIYLEKMRKIQRKIIKYIDDQDNLEDSLKIYNYYNNDFEKDEKIPKLKEILHLILHISNNHHRTFKFYEKIEQILLVFKEEIKQNFTSTEIFNTFYENKRILLFLIQDGFIQINKNIANMIIQSPYRFYFLYELGSYFQNQPFQIKQEQKEEFDIFDKKRKIGENDDYICQLIRNDSIQEFVAFVNKTNLSLKTIIKPSIFETNLFIINSNKTSLIEYAAFFGSIQIFKYLQMNNVELNSSLWNYVIHGNNPELINLLEENKVNPVFKNFKDCYIEAIKYHHNDVAKYFENNLLNEKIDVFSPAIQFRNYYFFNDDDIINHDFEFIKYDYISLVEIFIKQLKIDMNYSMVL